MIEPEPTIIWYTDLAGEVVPGVRRHHPSLCDQHFAMD